MASIAKFGKHLRELRFHMCQKSNESKEIRNFIEKFYVPIKMKNPTLPILIRECSGTQPKVYARYEYGVEKSVLLVNKSPDEILKHVNDLAEA